jgi:pyruvate, orthophosphate dikinase
MLDTVLNLGLNDESVAGLAARSGDERFAWDCYRRLAQMFGNVVCGIPASAARRRSRRSNANAV